MTVLGAIAIAPRFWKERYRAMGTHRYSTASAVRPFCPWVAIRSRSCSERAILLPDNPLVNALF
jgi:hypothetical protein